LIAATSSCHMLFFLSLAARRGFVIESYTDQAVGVMDKTAQGKIAITLITLRPHIQFAGNKLPSAEDVDAIHHDAHEQCYIANSLKAEIKVEGSFVV